MRVTRMHCRMYIVFITLCHVTYSFTIALQHNLPSLSEFGRGSPVPGPQAMDGYIQVDFRALLYVVWVVVACVKKRQCVVECGLLFELMG